MTVFLDSGVIWELVFHRETPAVLAVRNWFEKLALAGHEVVLSEINDYEVRRELLRKRATKDLRFLDDLLDRLTYLPITTPDMREAALVWAHSRQIGRSLADSQALDCDAILLGQFKNFALINPPAVIATTDVSDLKNFADARLWQDVIP